MHAWEMGFLCERTCSDRPVLGGCLDSLRDRGSSDVSRLCFSDRQPGEWGRVHKVRREEITATVADGWRVDSVEAATIDITTDPAGIRAWLAALTRI
jgi:hypothetical protein